MTQKKKIKINLLVSLLLFFGHNIFLAPFKFTPHFIGYLTSIYHIVFNLFVKNFLFLHSSSHTLSLYSSGFVYFPFYLFYTLEILFLVTKNFLFFNAILHNGYLFWIVFQYDDGNLKWGSKNSIGFSSLKFSFFPHFLNRQAWYIGIRICDH